MIPLRIVTLVVSPPTSPAVLVLQPLGEEKSARSRIVPIWIGGIEAGQLSLAIEHTRMPRPLTHDLFLDALTNLDARIDHVLINDVKRQMFFSKLYVRQAGRLIELDARPSDAIALAVRQGAPFYIEEDVLERGSFPYISREPSSETQLKEFHAFLETIAPDDFGE